MLERVFSETILDARINMYANVSHAWFPNCKLYARASYRIERAHCEYPGVRLPVSLTEQVLLLLLDGAGTQRRLALQLQLLLKLSPDCEHAAPPRHLIRKARIGNVGTCQSCMASRPIVTDNGNDNARITLRVRFHNR